MICIPIVASTNDEAARLMKMASAEPADMYELRLDAIGESPDVEGLIGAADRPVMAACRSAEQGGGFRGTVSERLALLQRSIDAGAPYVDAEEDVIGGLRRKNGVTLIASWRDPSGAPDDLPGVIGRLNCLPCDWVRFTVHAVRPRDGVAVLHAIANSGKPAIGLATGEIGVPTTVLGPAYGSMVTFGTLSIEGQSIPGQPTARELAETYRVKRITKNTNVYGLIGDPVSQSAGYRIHNQGYAVAGIDAVYISFQCPDAREFLDSVPDGLNIQGLSVTMPHKLAAMEWATTFTSSAKLIGASNTLAREADGWRAENTDFYGVARAVSDKALSSNLKLTGKPALVLGTGGAARAIGAALDFLGCKVAVAGRNLQKVDELIEKMNWAAIPWDERTNGDWVVVANSTPIGMHPDAESTPFPGQAWRPGMLAFESVYHPRETRFLREAWRAGALPVEGIEMFVHQAAGQFLTWTGRQLPADCYDSVRTPRTSLEIDRKGVA